MCRDLSHAQETRDCSGRCLLEIIRARAHQIYEARGRAEGYDLDDWLQAESEIKQHLGFESPCPTTPIPSS